LIYIFIFFEVYTSILESDLKKGKYLQVFQFDTNSFEINNINTNRNKEIITRRRIIHCVDDQCIVTKFLRKRNADVSLPYFVDNLENKRIFALR